MGNLGKVYGDGELIVRQGETGKCMYVIQDGRVEVVAEHDGEEIRLRELGKNDFFGEMAIFEHEVRTATVRAVGEARVLTIDKKNFLRGIHEDPSLAFRIVETMSHRIRDLTDRLHH
jgi:CRP-like cAMP-binding protein